jgi:hypothetical protein
LALIWIALIRKALLRIEAIRESALSATVVREVR